MNIYSGFWKILLINISLFFACIKKCFIFARIYARIGIEMFILEVYMTHDEYIREPESDPDLLRSYFSRLISGVDLQTVR